MSKVIMGVELQKRMQTSTRFQELLSEYGCAINTRIGLHQTSEEYCSDKGLIVLEFRENADGEISEFEKKLEKIDGVKIQKMIF